MPAKHYITVESKCEKTLSRICNEIMHAFEDQVTRGSSAKTIDSLDPEQIGMLSQAFVVNTTPRVFKEAPLDLGTQIIGHLRSEFRGTGIKCFRPREIDGRLEDKTIFHDIARIEALEA